MKFEQREAIGGWFCVHSQRPAASVVEATPMRPAPYVGAPFLPGKCPHIYFPILRVYRHDVSRFSGITK
jgi:hypothetical protein